MTCHNSSLLLMQQALVAIPAWLQLRRPLQQPQSRNKDRGITVATVLTAGSLHLIPINPRHKSQRLLVQIVRQKNLLVLVAHRPRKLPRGLPDAASGTRSAMLAAAAATWLGASIRRGKQWYPHRQQRNSMTIPTTAIQRRAM
jgi:hypothetical protein